MRRLWLLALGLACAALTAEAAELTINPFPDAPEVTIDVTNLNIAQGTISQPVKFKNPKGNAPDRKDIQLEVCSSTPQPVTWDKQWARDATGVSLYGLPLPTSTRGSGCDLWGFRFHASDKTWNFIASTPASRPSR